MDSTVQTESNYNPAAVMMVVVKGHLSFFCLWLGGKMGEKQGKGGSVGLGMGGGVLQEAGSSIAWGV